MKRSMLMTMMGCALALAANVFAQDLGVKAPRQDRPVWIINATIHPISGETINHGAIEFREGKITQIMRQTPNTDGKFKTENRVIDATGLHVWPGLVSANTQLGLIEIGAVRSTIDYAETGSVSPEVRAAVSVNPDSTVIPVTRSNGVLTAAVLPLGGTIPGRASVIRLDGWTWEDMTILDDAGLVLNWPNMRPNTSRWSTRSVEEQKKDIEENLKRIDDSFDAAEAYAEARKSDSSLPVDLRWEAMRGALDGTKPIFVRANEIDQIQAAVSWAVNRGVKIVIVGGRDASECADLLKRHEVGVIVTGTHRLPKRRDSAYDEAYMLPVVLEEAGVKWCLATGGGGFDTPHERNLPYHAASSVAFGLSPEAAMRAITLSPAELLGVEKNVGSLDTGKAATLIITDGHPLEVTTNVYAAFIDGRDVDLQNKQTKLNEKYREKYRQLGLIDQ